jgi:hypothetical protein
MERPKFILGSTQRRVSLTMQPEDIDKQINMAEGALSAAYFVSVIMYNALIDFSENEAFDKNERYKSKQILLKYRDILSFLSAETSETRDVEGITFESARALWAAFEKLPMTKENTAISFNTPELQCLLQIECAGSAVWSSYNLVRKHFDPLKPTLEKFRKYGMAYTLDKFERFFIRYSGIANDMKALERIIYTNLKRITGKEEIVIKTRLDQLSHLFIDKGYAKLNAKKYERE